MDPVAVLSVVAILIAIAGALANVHAYFRPKGADGTGKNDSRRGRVAFVSFGLLLIVGAVVLGDRLYQYFQSTRLPDAARAALADRIVIDEQNKIPCGNFNACDLYKSTGGWSVTSAAKATAAYNSHDYVSGVQGEDELWCITISPPLEYFLSGDPTSSSAVYLPISHFWAYRTGNVWHAVDVDGPSTGTQSPGDNSGAVRAFTAVGCTY